MLLSRSLVVALVLCVALTSAAYVEVNTEYGKLRGVSNGGVNTFLGIPFATPPLGSLRWAPPLAPASHNGVRDCLKTAPACMQKPHSLFKLDGISEDCLYLNVYAPAEVSTPRPVLVWIHGGSFSYGSSSESKYNGSVLVLQQDVVVVVINYRLGLFGFLAQEAFLNENANPSAGLYGSMDQQLALQWVKSNIASFGGDPSQVSVFGESAGGMSVCILLGMPSSAGLFNRAIIESGPCNGYMPLQTAFAKGDTFATSVGCDPTQLSGEAMRNCLRSKSAADVLVHQLQFPEIGPVVDGNLLPKEPINMMRDGNSVQVPILVGSNSNEGGLFVEVMFSPNITNDEYYDILKDYVGPIVAPVVYGMYPPLSYGGNAGKALSALIGDMVFTCPTENTAKANSARVSTFAYLFSHTPSWVPQTSGAYHGAEIPFVFGVSEYGDPYTTAERQLLNAMQSYWVSFANDGNPNVSNLTNWPQYTENARTRIVLDTTNPLKTTTNYRNKQCEFWDTVYSLAGSVLGGAAGRVNKIIHEMDEVMFELREKALV